MAYTVDSNLNRERLAVRCGTVSTGNLYGDLQVAQAYTVFLWVCVISDPLYLDYFKCLRRVVDCVVLRSRENTAQIYGGLS
jgi:hypothetical protein